MPGPLRAPRPGEQGFYSTRPTTRPALGSAPAALRRLTSWYDAYDLTSPTQTSLASRLGSAVAPLGATTAVETSDPYSVYYKGSSYFVGSAAAQSYLGVPSPTTAAANDITLVCRIGRPAVAGTYPFGCVQGRGVLGAWSLYWDANSLGVYGFNDANSNFLLQAVWAKFTNTPVSSTGTYWVRLERKNANWWVAVEADTGSNTPPIFRAPVNLGADTGGRLACNAGYHFGDGAAPSRIDMHYASLSVDSAPPVVVDCNMVQGGAVPPSSFRSVSGHTITVVRPVSNPQLQFVGRPFLEFDGVNDILQLPATDQPTFDATTGAYSVIVCARVPDVSVVGTLWSDEVSLNRGSTIYVSSAGDLIFQVGGATTTAFQAVSPTFDDGTLRVFGGVQNNGLISAFESTAGMSSTSSTAGIGAITRVVPKVGARGFSSNFLQGEILSVGIGNGVALSATEMSSIAAYMLLGAYR